MKNNKGRNLYKHLFIVLPVFNLIKHEFFILEALGHTQFGDGFQVDSNFGFEILDCYHLITFP